MANTYVYHTPYDYNGKRYTRGDQLTVTGKCYTNSGASASATGDYSNKTVYFYGFLTVNGDPAAHPLGLANSATATNATLGFMDMSAIVSGGTSLSYTVTINLNGGTATDGFTSFPVIVGTNTWYVFNGYQPTRSGYKFKGLYTAATGGEQVYFENGLACGDGTYWEAALVGDGSGSVTYTWIYSGNVTLYAQWERLSYTLTINPNGGTWNGTTSNSTVTKLYQSTYTVENPTRTGYRFTGWTKSGTGSLSGTTFAFGAGNCTLKANWVAVYYLDLNIYLNGTVQSSTSVCHCDVTVNGSSAATNVADYYTQHDTGSTWSISDIVVGSGYTRYSTGTTSGTLTANASCNIYIGQNYTVTYNANGGTGGTTQTVNYGTSWTTKGAICEKTGYKQTGWNTKQDGSGDSYSLNTAQTNKQSSNLTLYAIYGEGEQHTYDIVYKSSSGKTIGTSSATYAHGTTNTISPVSFDGYTSPSSQSVTWDSVNKTITFTYTPISYSISYTLNGGESVSNKTSYTIETNSFILINPIREGYRFDGWTGSNGNTANVNVTVSKGTCGNLSYTANWTPLDSDERKIYIYKDGTIEAAMFIESDSKFGFYNTGTVYAKEFIEGYDWFGITEDGKIYCNEIVARI